VREVRRRENQRDGRLTSISIAAEVACPGDVRVALVLARGDGVQADGGDDGCVAQGGLGGDDAVGDVVVDGLCGPLAFSSISIPKIVEGQGV
jgi:hypothetical protein